MCRVRASAEGRHPPTPDPAWAESYGFDFFSPDCRLGGSVTLTMFPNRGVSWYWACVVGRGRPLVALLEHEAPLPRAGTLELRTSGLWSELQCEGPLELFTVGLEAFALVLDSPEDAYVSPRGDRVPLGCDLEWETDGSVAGGEADGYELPCRVRGDVLVGPERHELDAWGWRDHRWGACDWWQAPRARLRGRRDDGSPLLTERVEVEGVVRDVGPVAWAPVPVDVPGRAPVRLVRGLVRVPRVATGWLEQVRS